MSDDGDFIVLRTSGTDAYNTYIMGLGKPNSVSTFLLKTAAASEDDFVLGMALYG